MSEPVGLNLSLDDLIKKQQPSSFRRDDRGGRHGGRGAFAARGGVTKVRSPPAQQGQRFGRGGYAGGRHTEGSFSSRGGFQGNRGGFGQGRGQHGGRFGAHNQGPSNQNFRQQQGNFRGGPQRPFQQRSFQQQQRNFPGGIPLVAPDPPPRPAPAQATNQMQVDDSSMAPEENTQSVTVWRDVETGDVVATLNNTNVVTVGPDGAVLLDTGGWFNLQTLTAMNEVLSVLGMKVVVKPGSDITNGANWAFTDNKTMQIFTGNELLLQAKGPAVAVRGELLFAAYNDPAAFELAQTNSAARLGVMGVGSSGGYGQGMRGFGGGMGAGQDAMFGGGMSRGGGMGMGQMGMPSLQGMGGMWGGGMGAGMQVGGAGMAAAAPGVIGSIKQAAGLAAGPMGADADTARRLRAQGRLGY